MTWIIRQYHRMLERYLFWRYPELTPEQEREFWSE